MKVLHFVVGAVVLTRVPDVDLSIGYISIVCILVVDADKRNVVDTQQVNSPPGFLFLHGVCTYCLNTISSSSRRVGDLYLICVV